MKSLLAALFVTVLVSGFSAAFAHKTVTVEQYEIEVGWRDEPPLVSQQNAIVFSITTEEGQGVKSGVTNAFRDLTATVKSGSLTKTLDILSDVKPGHYYSKIIPTKTGTLTVELTGSIGGGVPINEQVDIEDVESLDIIAFPPAGSAGQADTAQLKNAMASIQKDVSELKSKVGNTGAGNVDLSKSYDFAVFGLAIGAAGVILAVIAMIKRK
ncbi:MAG TPA: hypothetical protein VNK44_01005 [Candidatus Nitrosotenuis sp.]|nr:hypothetical protein [Candidatus Nitrosotenuis sp.]